MLGGVGKRDKAMTIEGEMLSVGRIRSFRERGLANNFGSSSIRSFRRANDSSKTESDLELTGEDKEARSR